MLVRKLKSKSLLMLFLLVILPACVDAGRSTASTATPVPPLVTYERTIYTVERGPIVSEKEILAEITPSLQDDLFFRSSGYITRVSVKQGDFVKQGDVLAELQVDDLLNQLEQARIDLEVAQARLEDAKTQREYAIARAGHEVSIWELRVELAKLDVENAYGEDNINRAELNLALIEENLALAMITQEQASEEINIYDLQAVERSQLAVERLEALLAERQIVAPYDCVILLNRIRPGQSADAYVPYFKVGDPTDLVISARQESEISAVINEDTEIYLRMSMDDTQEYRVTYLPDFLPLSSQETDEQKAEDAYYYFKIPEALPEDDIKVGKSVRLRVVLGRKEDVLLLPPLSIRNFGGVNFVIVLEGDDKRRRVDIFEIGLTTDDLWEINADLEEGDLILGP